jgi:hypothetical protein
MNLDSRRVNVNKIHLLTQVAFEDVQVLLFDTDSKTGCPTSRTSKFPDIVYSNVGLQWAEFSSVREMQCCAANDNFNSSDFCTGSKLTRRLPFSPQA